MLIMAFFKGGIINKLPTTNIDFLNTRVHENKMADDFYRLIIVTSESAEY